MTINNAISINQDVKLIKLTRVWACIAQVTLIQQKE